MEWKACLINHWILFYIRAYLLTSICAYLCYWCWSCLRWRWQQETGMGGQKICPKNQNPKFYNRCCSSYSLVGLYSYFHWTIKALYINFTFYTMSYYALVKNLFLPKLWGRCCRCIRYYSNINCTFWLNNDIARFPKCYFKNLLYSW